MIKLYCGINETKWNHHPVEPGEYACIAPVYGKTEKTKKENRVKIPKYTHVIQDSGAFSDGPKSRLSFKEALNRQLSHSEKYNYCNQITHRASYDLLIDEVWNDGNRYKRRWSENDAEWAVEETINAAKFLSMNYDDKKILSAQGVTAKQYLDCCIRVLNYFNSKNDIFGLGGWCIIGKMPKVMMGVFCETIKLIVPVLAKNNVKKIHIWGVIYPIALGNLLWMCDEYNMELSTDSAGPSYRPAFGLWGYKGWTDKNYKRVDTSIRGYHRMMHVQATRMWLKEFRTTEFYKKPTINNVRQMSLFENY